MTQPLSVLCRMYANLRSAHVTPSVRMANLEPLLLQVHHVVVALLENAVLSRGIVVAVQHFAVFWLDAKPHSALVLQNLISLRALTSSSECLICSKESIMARRRYL